MNTKELPFKVQIYDDEPVLVKNRFGFGECMLEPEAVAVYDTIMGAELLGEYDTVRKGLKWFRQHYPEEYMILLD